MLTIGFTEKYYTLWDVNEETKYTSTPNGSFPVGIKTNFVYLQNLSFDKQSAIDKVKKIGITNPQIDTSLRGVTRSFSTYKKIDIPDNLFQFGKYHGTEISDSIDLNYLLWYYAETKSDIALSRIKELNDESNEYIIHTDSDGLVRFYKSEWYFEYNGMVINNNLSHLVDSYEELESKIKNLNQFEFTFNFNVNNSGVITLFDYEFIFENIKSFEYSGHLYYLPVIDGKSIRIKNKKKLYTVSHICDKRYKVVDIGNVV